MASEYDPYYETEATRQSLPALASRIALEVEEIDACARMGAIDACGDFSLYSTHLRKHQIDKALSEAVSNPRLMECPKREEWIDSCLTRFRHYLGPSSVCFEVEGDAHQFVVDFSGRKIRVTRELIETQKFWGVQFYSKKRNHDKEIANLYLKVALNRLFSDISSVNRFCTEWEKDSAYLNSVTFTHSRRGNLFEQLMLGVLNQTEPTVIQSSMYEDVRQWSDLRIIRKGALKNTHIQVKFVHRVADHKVSASHFMAGKTILLSPLSIAESLETSFNPDLFGCTWSDILSLFRDKPKTTEDLAFQLYHLFDDLFEAAPTHPLSPIIGVPQAIQIAIHILVAEQAAEVAFRKRWKEAVLKAADLNSEFMK